MQEKTKTPANAVRMSPEEWRTTHRDFKSNINGQRYVLRMTLAGTSLVPVEIVKVPKK